MGELGVLIGDFRNGAASASKSQSRRMEVCGWKGKEIIGKEKFKGKRPGF